MLKTSLSGDMKIDPIPAQKIQNKSFPVCHWNLNSIAAHGYAKLLLLRSYITAYKMNIICLSETYLDSSKQSDNDNLKVPGYNLVRSDHPSNNKLGGVCIYYKALLLLRVIDSCFRQVMIGDNQCNFVALYRSLFQDQDQFHSF